jgi:hypothetical protein
MIACTFVAGSMFNIDIISTKTLKLCYWVFTKKILADVTVAVPQSKRTTPAVTFLCN